MQETVPQAENLLTSVAEAGPQQSATYERLLAIGRHLPKDEYLQSRYETALGLLAPETEARFTESAASQVNNVEQQRTAGYQRAEKQVREESGNHVDRIFDTFKRNNPSDQWLSQRYGTDPLNRTASFVTGNVQRSAEQAQLAAGMPTLTAEADRVIEGTRKDAKVRYGNEGSQMLLDTADPSIDEDTKQGVVNEMVADRGLRADQHLTLLESFVSERVASKAGFGMLRAAKGDTSRRLSKQDFQRQAEQGINSLIKEMIFDDTTLYRQAENLLRSQGVRSINYAEVAQTIVRDLDGRIGNEITPDTIKALITKHTDRVAESLIGRTGQNSEAQTVSRDKDPIGFDPLIVRELDATVAALRAQGFTDEQIRKELMRKFHPDTNTDDLQAAEKFKYIESLKLGK